MPNIIKLPWNAMFTIYITPSPCVLSIYSLTCLQGAQIFEAVGLSREVMDLCFTGSASRIGGVSFKHLAEEVSTTNF